MADETVQESKLIASLREALADYGQSNVPRKNILLLAANIYEAMQQAMESFSDTQPNPLSGVQIHVDGALPDHIGLLCSERWAKGDPQATDREVCYLVFGEA